MSESTLKEKPTEDIGALFQGGIIDANSEMLRTVINQMPGKKPLIPLVNEETDDEQCPDTSDCEPEQSIECEPETQDDCPTVVSCPSVETTECPSESCSP